jgi:hypothetical protein
MIDSIVASRMVFIKDLEPSLVLSGISWKKSERNCACASEIGLIDVQFLTWDREGMRSVFMGQSPGYGFPPYLDLTPIAID